MADFGSLDTKKYLMMKENKALQEQASGNGVTPSAQQTLNQQLSQSKKDLNLSRNQNLLQMYRDAAAGKGLSPSNMELAAGIRAPEFQGITDEQGNLQSQFKTNPYAGEALQNLKGQAFSQGPSAWANLQTQQQRMEQQNAKDQLMKGAMQSQGAAQNQLARTGGLSGGASALLARQGQRDLLNQGQELARTGMGQRLGIQQQDIANKQGLLGKFGEMEANANQANIEALKGNLSGQAAFNTNRYNQQMQGYAAGQSAQATRDAGKSSGGGCCFIFLEARYGNGTMDKVVRRYRNEKMTERNQRGYYKVAEVLVPLMRKSKIAKFLTRVLMTDPLVSYGKYYYGEGKVGIIFTPLKSFWLKVFDVVGGDTKFLRENGEVI